MGILFIELVAVCELSKYQRCLLQESEGSLMDHASALEAVLLEGGRRLV